MSDKSLLVERLESVLESLERIPRLGYCKPTVNVNDIFFSNIMMIVKGNI